MSFMLNIEPAREWRIAAIDLFLATTESIQVAGNGCHTENLVHDLSIETEEYTNGAAKGPRASIV